MKSVIVIAGTRDGRAIIEKLLNIEQLDVHATVATVLGEEFLQAYPDLTIHAGRLDRPGMAELIRAIQAAAVIDASHPFAAETSRNAIAACAETGIPYLRYEREETPLGQVVRVDDFREAAESAATYTGNILLTVGSNHLDVFTARIPEYRERLFVRVLPDSAVLAKCERLGLTARQIIALQGPFSEALNREIYQYCQAAVIVTKDSGATGGNPEKIAAATSLNLPVIMVARPRIDYGAKVFNMEEIIGFGKGLAQAELRGPDG